MVQDGAPFEHCIKWNEKAGPRNTIYVGAGDFAVTLSSKEEESSFSEIVKAQHPTCVEVVFVAGTETAPATAVPVFRNPIVNYLMGLWHARNAFARANAKLGRYVYREQQVHLHRNGASSEFVLSLKGNNPDEWIRDSAASRQAYARHMIASCPGDEPGLADAVENMLKRCAECPLAQAVAARHKVDTMLSGLQDFMDGGDMDTVILLLKELRCVPAIGNSSTYNRIIQWCIAHWEASSSMSQKKMDKHDTARETSAGSNSYTTTDQNFENCQRNSKQHHRSATIEDLRQLNVELRDGNFGHCLPLNEPQHEVESTGPGRTTSTHHWDRDLADSYYQDFQRMKLLVVGSPLHLTSATGTERQFDRRAFVLSTGMGMNPDFLLGDAVGDEQADRVVDGEILKQSNVQAPSVSLLKPQAKTGDWQAVGNWTLANCEDGKELCSSHYDKDSGEVFVAEPRGVKPTKGTFVAPVGLVRKQLLRLRVSGVTDAAKDIAAAKELALLDRLEACVKLCTVNLAERIAAGTPAPPQPIGCDPSKMAIREPITVSELPTRLRSLGREFRQTHGMPLPKAAAKQLEDATFRSMRPMNLQQKMQADAHSIAGQRRGGPTDRQLGEHADRAAGTALGQDVGGARVRGGELVAVQGVKRQRGNSQKRAQRRPPSPT